MGPRVFGSIAVYDGTSRRSGPRRAGSRGRPATFGGRAATLCARLGADPFVVALILGRARPDERMPAVTGAYLRWDYEDKVREVLHRLGAWVEETAGRATEPGDVVNIGRAHDGEGQAKPQAPRARRRCCSTSPSSS